MAADTYTAGVDVATGDLITAATWNNMVGAGGSVEWARSALTYLWVPLGGGYAVAYDGNSWVQRGPSVEIDTTKWPTPTSATVKYLYSTGTVIDQAYDVRVYNEDAAASIGDGAPAASQSFTAATFTVTLAALAANSYHLEVHGGNNGGQGITVHWAILEIKPANS